MIIKNITAKAKTIYLNDATKRGFLDLNTPISAQEELLLSPKEQYDLLKNKIHSLQAEREILYNMIGRPSKKNFRPTMLKAKHKNIITFGRSKTLKDQYSYLELGNKIQDVQNKIKGLQNVCKCCGKNFPFSKYDDCASCFLKNKKTIKNNITY
jgi:hypothetical protein